MFSSYSTWSKPESSHYTLHGWTQLTLYNLNNTFKNYIYLPIYCVNALVYVLWWVKIEFRVHLSGVSSLFTVWGSGTKLSLSPLNHPTSSTLRNYCRLFKLLSGEYTVIDRNVSLLDFLWLGSGAAIHSRLSELALCLLLIGCVFACIFV